MVLIAAQRIIASSRAGTEAGYRPGAGPDREHAETSMLALTPEFHDRMGEAERRGLSPLFWTHVDPYGRFRLDMNTRLDLTAAPARESIT